MWTLLFGDTGNTWLFPDDDSEIWRTLDSHDLFGQWLNLSPNHMIDRNYLCIAHSEYRGEDLNRWNKDSKPGKKSTSSWICGAQVTGMTGIGRWDSLPRLHLHMYDTHRITLVPTLIINLNHMLYVLVS